MQRRTCVLTVDRCMKVYEGVVVQTCPTTFLSWPDEANGGQERSDARDRWSNERRRGLRSAVDLPAAHSAGQLRGNEPYHGTSLPSMKGMRLKELGEFMHVNCQ